MSSYSFNKTPLSIDRLTHEIRLSAITVALEGVSAIGIQVTINFKAALSEAEQAILGTIIAEHTGEPMPENVSQPVEIVKQPEPQPFAQPLYRTKRSAIAAPMECQAGGEVDLDFKITEERYVSGGEIIVENAEFGDYVTAEVEDVDGIIPSQYRIALCEAHPTVARYIEKAFIPVEIPGSIQAGSVTRFEIDTYPLNAKITAGLYLCINYHAVNSGLTRKIAVNYHLTKKL